MAAFGGENTFEDGYDDRIIRTRNGTNLFDADDDDKFEDISSELAGLKQEKELHEQRMVESSYRSLRMINESQTVASETAEELDKQRKQLERTKNTLHKMDSDLNQTDRHITSLKSVWGTMSNWFKKPVTPVESTPKISSVSKAIKEDDAVIRNNLNSIDRKVDLSWDSSSSSNSHEKSSTDKIVDENLDQMLAGLMTLKAQGLTLGTEIDKHNELITDIHGLSENIDKRVDGQNTKINKILR